MLLLHGGNIKALDGFLGHMRTAHQKMQQCIIQKVEGNNRVRLLSVRLCKYCHKEELQGTTEEGSWVSVPLKNINKNGLCVSTRAFEVALQH